MNRRIAWILALACAVVPLIAPAPAAGQTPVPAQVSPQTVRAAIPPQAPQPAVPAAASAPSVAGPATAPTPAVAALPAAAVPPVPATAPVPPQAATAPVPQAKPVQAPVAAPPMMKPMADYEAANVKVEVTITYQVGSGKPVQRTASLTVADQGRGSLRSGTQVAVPQTTFQPAATGAPATPPMTSYSYKSVGLNVDANRVSVLGNRARMDLNVEFSAVDEKPTTLPSGSYPVFPTFSQNLTLVLESGKEVVVGQSSDVVDNQERKQTVTVKATILR